jgi:hypothetical protein
VATYDATTRREIVLRAGALTLAPVGAALSSVGVRAQTPAGLVIMYRAKGCGCCLAWADHLRHAGFVVETHEPPTAELAAIKVAAGLRPEHQSCHTAKIAGYTIEGHVPALDIKRLLETRPVAAGLTVPQMPLGAPGMENGTRREAYDVLLFQRDGTSRPFSRYEART